MLRRCIRCRIWVTSSRLLSMAKEVPRHLAMRSKSASRFTRLTAPYRIAARPQGHFASLYRPPHNLRFPRRFLRGSYSIRGPLPHSLGVPGLGTTSLERSGCARELLADDSRLDAMEVRDVQEKCVHACRVGSIWFFSIHCFCI